MTGTARPKDVRSLRAEIERWGATRPDMVLVAPFMTYLLLLGLTDALPTSWQPVTITARGVLSLLLVGAFWRHLPPWGRPHWLIAIIGGVLCAWGWVAGQYAFDHLGLGGRLPGYPGQAVTVDPRDALGGKHLFVLTWVLRMSVAVIAVPVVEELFWRAFLLRALIQWNDFERVPLGRFTWFSFVGTSLLSTLQHPDNWGVSILCWMVFNGVFYWTRSILCVVLLHGVTNLVLYAMVLRVRDWSFW